MMCGCTGTSGDCSAACSGCTPSFVKRAQALFDRGRCLLTSAGARPWRVFIVKYQWSGGDIGRGDPRKVKVVEITPRPIVVDESALQNRSFAFGQAKEGRIWLKEISTRYHEEDLDILFKPLSRGEEVFIETIQDEEWGGKAPIRRDYKPFTTPELRPTEGQWIMQLTNIDDERTKDGRRVYWSAQ
jgi:hypothetical protein